MRLSTSALCVGYRLRTTNQTAGICIGCERLGPVGMLPAAYRRADGSLDCPNRISLGRELTPADEAAAMADDVTHGVATWVCHQCAGKA